jgi:hypothetical protein
MPDLNAKVTLKDVEETSMIVRTLEKTWTREKFFTSVSLLLFNVIFIDLKRYDG